MIDVAYAAHRVSIGRIDGGHHAPEWYRGGPANSRFQPLREPDRPQGGATCQAAGLGDCSTGHSRKVGVAHNLVKSDVEPPVLVNTGQ